MCRLFGFRSVIHSSVHSSLLTADNALQVQSQKNPDGWGLSYYIAGTPHILKSTKSAVEDALFKKVSGVVSSNTVLAHVRAATQGENTILNAHPFQFGHWTFAHNGNIKNFLKHKEELLKLIPQDIGRYRLGTTDSEIIFFILLGKLNQRTSIETRHLDIQHLLKSVKEAIRDICKIIGPFHEVDQAENTNTFLSFIITNGKSMLAFQGGKTLFCSTYKKHCEEEKTCLYFNDSCLSKVENAPVNHVIFASEPTTSENIWEAMQPGDITAVDDNLHLFTDFYSQE